MALALLTRNRLGSFYRVLTNDLKDWRSRRNSRALGVEDRMSLSRRSVEMLLDLVEIKISYMDVADREDARDLVVLERCLQELRSLPGLAGAPVSPAPLTRRDGRAPIAA